MLAFLKRSLFSNLTFVFGVYAVLMMFATVRITLFEGSNNYAIFYYSLSHLIDGTNLYALYPAEYLDRYHYAPSFPALAAPLFWLPYAVGLFIWQLLFAAVWVYAVYRLPLTQGQKVFAYWFALHELFTSIVNSQTNPFIAAIPIFVYLCFEKQRPSWAAFLLIVGFYIKIYSLVGAALFLLYPGQRVRFIAYMAFWAVALGLMPLLFTSPASLLEQYRWWVEELFLKSDSDKWINTSIHRILHLFVSPDIPTAAIIGGGVVLFCTVYAQIRRFSEHTFRMLLLASVLIFQVIFNPIAESPVYIVAVTGVLIWWFASPQTGLDRALLIACFVLTVVSKSDIFPDVLRDRYVLPYVLRAFPCALIWFRIIYLMHVPMAVQKPSDVELKPIEYR